MKTSSCLWCERDFPEEDEIVVEVWIVVPWSQSVYRLPRAFCSEGCVEEHEVEEAGDLLATDKLCNEIK